MKRWRDEEMGRGRVTLGFFEGGGVSPCRG